MAASSSTSVSASTADHSNSNQSYEVFINHRGVDVKKTFARSLYLRLLSNGLRAFLDQQELQQGYNFPSQIEHAIRTAHVHVAIFSPRYAESNWCLDELLLMLESKAPILPVFYKVEPFELRRTRGIYAQALQNLAEKKTHEEKLQYDSNTINNWRNAISLVADNSGFVLELCNGEALELELIDKVVKRVLQMVKRPDLHVAEYPTGLDYKLEHFENEVLLGQHHSSKPQILGIWGLGGIGKTTLAKQFFNRKKLNYDKYCFLFDVRDHAGKTSFNSLQRKLLKSLTGLDKPVDSVEEGKGMLIEPLKTSKAFIILDDVDDVNQVNALLPVQTHDFHSESLILITSRDKQVLRGSKVQNSSIYRLTRLEIQHSRELFCAHAFSKPYPLPGFESLVDEFLKVCNGLPLSLKVFGALLYGRDISDWEVELGSLQQILPTQIQKAFMISYNSLNREEKHIFLDIACFFIGENRDTAIGIWDGSGWKGRRGFQNLQNKGLVEVDWWNVIHMHDHLRDLRIDVAEISSPRRLWRLTNEVIDNLLQQSSGLTVRGIKMVHVACNGHDEDDVLDLNDTEKTLLECNLRRLRILHTENALLERILRRVELPNLIWLCWEKCSHSSLPSWVPMKNLRFLRVSKSVLNTLWQKEGESEGSLQPPVCLEELWADGSVKLRSIGGLEQATKLRQLRVSGCSELEELPSMETLLCLEELWADGCVQLKSIQGLAGLTKLRRLNVNGCSELEELTRMETLVSLEVLLADGCVKLKRIRGLGQCTRLLDLKVCGCSELEELPSMETLLSLNKLNVKGCVKLKSIPGLAQCTKLEDLFVSGCSELEVLPSMETWVYLTSLWADPCVKLQKIQGLGKCTRLQILSVSGCSELKELPSMETMVSLEYLYAEGCVKLKRIRASGQCKKLRLLDVAGCSELEELPSMESLVSLEELWVSGCAKLKNILGLVQATKLRLLCVSSCYELQDLYSEELPSTETLLSLQRLYAEGCVQLKRMRGLVQMTNLQTIVVTGCCELEELTSMETLVSLEDLTAIGCVRLNSIQGLEHLTKLRFLNVGACFELEELPSMETLVSLETLAAVGCVKWKSIRGLAQLTKLTVLDVRHCSNLEEVEGVEHCTWLETLEVFGCTKLQCPVWE